ncbi:MBL fold metallo-hydrolase [Spirillospora sp. CA-255316]
MTGGLFRVYALRYARREGRRGQHFHGYDERWDEPHPTAYYVWPALSGRHTVVVDTGIAPDTAHRLEGIDYHASPMTLLAELGVAAGSVDHVVLTHLHYDHTGTAAAFENAAGRAPAVGTGVLDRPLGPARRTGTPAGQRRRPRPAARGAGPPAAGGRGRRRGALFRHRIARIA